MTINNKVKNPIGFFDSGIGGLTVMREAVKLMPNENYIYFGDSKNAPYGTKTVNEVKELSFRATEFLLSKGAKAIVVACNTATSAAIEDLRNQYADIPIIGIEPALKPAVKKYGQGKVVIMATPMTLAEKKFSSLLDKYKGEAEIIPLPCAGLVEFIERGILDGIELEQFLKEKFSLCEVGTISSVVLGCTHYPFVKDAISKVLGNKVIIIDGSEGTARELKRRLEDEGLLNTKLSEGWIEIYNSANTQELIDLSYKLLNL